MYKEQKENQHNIISCSPFQNVSMVVDINRKAFQIVFNLSNSKGILDIYKQIILIYQIQTEMCTVYISGG